MVRKEQNFKVLIEDETLCPLISDGL